MIERIDVYLKTTDTALLLVSELNRYVFEVECTWSDDLFHITGNVYKKILGSNQMIICSKTILLIQNKFKLKLFHDWTLLSASK